MKNFVMIFVLLLIPSLLLAQDKGKIVTFLPAGQISSDAEKKQVDTEKENIRLSGFMSKLMLYLSVSQENKSLCTDQLCSSEAESLLAKRYVAEGRCSELKDLTAKRVCEAFKANNSNLCQTAEEREYYNAINNGDVDYLARVLEKESSPSEAKAKALFLLGILNGFKYYNIMACERYVSQIDPKSPAFSFSRQLSCGLLFASDPKQKVESILTDLALLRLSNKNNDKSLCEKIDNQKIKSACISGNKNILSKW